MKVYLVDKEYPPLYTHVGVEFVNSPTDADVIFLSIFSPVWTQKSRRDIFAVIDEDTPLIYTEYALEMMVEAKRRGEI